MQQEFEGRVAVVTGASSGIGRATAELLEERGAKVVRFSRTDRDVTGDVSNEADVARLFDEAGPCDILINNAGTIETALLHEMSAKAWDRTFAERARRLP